MLNTGEPELVIKPLIMRSDIINEIIRRRFPSDCRYLEIGVCVPENNFNRIIAKHKVGVDPGKESDSAVTHQMTSDEYFKQHNDQFDVIFIDGLHISYQVYIDAENALERLSPNGFLVFHDCSPPTWQRAHSDYQEFLNCQIEWNGSCWKAWYYMRTHWPYATVCVDTDEGIGIMSKGRTATPIEHKNHFYDFFLMKLNRKADLGLVSTTEFYENFDELL